MECPIFGKDEGLIIEYENGDEVQNDFKTKEKFKMWVIDASSPIPKFLPKEK